VDGQIYNYKAILERVIDGDTIVVTLALGLGIHMSKFKIRMAYIDAPEMRDKPFGQESKDFIIDFIANKAIVVKTKSDKKDKYGRYLCEVYVKTGDEWVSVNSKMLTEGQAVKYKGLVDEQLQEFIY
jgi:micrococcal nuclease